MKTANQVSPKHLVVSSEAAAIAVGYDKLIATLDVPVEALRGLVRRGGIAMQRYQAAHVDACRRREHVRLYGRIYSNVIKRARG